MISLLSKPGSSQVFMASSSIQRVYMTSLVRMEESAAGFKKCSSCICLCLLPTWWWQSMMDFLEMMEKHVLSFINLICVLMEVITCASLEYLFNLKSDLMTNKWLWEELYKTVLSRTCYSPSRTWSSPPPSSPPARPRCTPTFSSGRKSDSALEIHFQ